ncbi:MAG: hypothetical protein ACE5GE_14195, partial [Phycisphaerae bacterium]
EETRLRQRFAESYENRQAGRFAELHAMIDPEDLGEVTLDKLAAAEKKIEHFSCRLLWVDVIGDRGRSHASYVSRLDDPSLRKMPPQEREITEYWIQRDGHWYLDLMR